MTVTLAGRETVFYFLFFILQAFTGLAKNNFIQSRTRPLLIHELTNGHKPKLLLAFLERWSVQRVCYAAEGGGGDRDMPCMSAGSGLIFRVTGEWTGAKGLLPDVCIFTPKPEIRPTAKKLLLY